MSHQVKKTLKKKKSLQVNGNWTTHILHPTTIRNVINKIFILK